MSQNRREFFKVVGAGAVGSMAVPGISIAESSQVDESLIRNNRNVFTTVSMETDVVVAGADRGCAGAGESYLLANRGFVVVGEGLAGAAASDDDETEQSATREGCESTAHARIISAKPQTRKGTGVEGRWISS